jgi:hypothetical protein
MPLSLSSDPANVARGSPGPRALAGTRDDRVVCGASNSRPNSISERSRPVIDAGFQ